MYATHHAFRRDLERLSKAVAAGRAACREVRAGWQNFTRQLEVHHSVEDAELWPRLRRAVASRPDELAMLAEMEAEHARLDPLLHAVDQALARRSEGLAEAVRELSAVLSAHMRHEEDSAMPLVQEVLTQADWDAFRRAMGRRQGVRGAAVYVPWVADGLSSGDRSRFLAGMPAPVRVLNRLVWEAGYRKQRLWQY